MCLCGFESGKKYTVTVDTLGYKSGDVYNAYLDAGFTELPTREETVELAKKAEPKRELFEFLADFDGKLSFSLPQNENQVNFIRISL